MEKCKTCAFWRGQEGEIGKYECMRIGEWNDEPAKILIEVSDDSGLQSYFMTSSEFGCSLHKAKEDGKLNP